MGYRLKGSALRLFVGWSRDSLFDQNPVKRSRNPKSEAICHIPCFHTIKVPFMGTSSLSWAYLPFHGRIFPFMDGAYSFSWAGHIPFHGRFPFMGTSSLLWAHLPFHRHIFPFVAASSPSLCSHHSSSANLNTQKQTESEAKAKFKQQRSLI